MKRLKKNNKGFSLVELIAAVAILAVVVTPLLHSFVTSTKISNRATEISEATLAGKNILEAVDARPLSEYQRISSTNSAAELLGDGVNGATITPLGDFDSAGDIIPGEEGNFEIALQNVKVANALYDAKVEFSRGDKDEQITVGEETKDSTSHGLYLINGKELAKYSGMDGVFCQSYLKTENPDSLADDAYSRKARDIDSMPPKYNNRERYIKLDVEQDEDGYVWARVTYTYMFTYNELDNDGYPTGRELKWPESFNPNARDHALVTRQYTIFRGGFEPKNKDGSVSIYLMFYPDYYKHKAEDSDIEVVRSNKDIIDVYNVRHGDIPPVNLNVFIYKQKPLIYNATTDTYDELDIRNVPYEAEIDLFVPPDFELNPEEGVKRKSLIYTNINEAPDEATEGLISFTFKPTRALLLDDAGDDYNYGDDEENPLFDYETYIYLTDNPDYQKQFSVVRKGDSIRIYNIRITLYKKNSASITTGTGESGNVKTSCEFSGRPVYIVEGSKTP